MKQFMLIAWLLLSVCSRFSMAQTCDPSLTAEITSSRYGLDVDGVVIDKKNNVSWLRCALGQTWANNTCTGAPKLIPWQEAIETAKNMSFAGQKDWRLPTQEELQSLLEKDCDAPAINETAFPNVPPTGVYWSATEIGGLSSGAWTVNFYDGGDYWGYSYDYNAVRLVRTGLIEKPVVAMANCTASDTDKDGVNDCNDKCPGTMAGSTIDAVGCPVSIELKVVQFELDSAVLTEPSKRILDAVAKDLIRYPTMKKDIEIQGHASSEASFAHNLQLSQRRAQAVVSYLKKQGVKDKLFAQGYGEDHPVVSNKTQQGRVRNRRVELHWLEKPAR